MVKFSIFWNIRHRLYAAKGFLGQKWSNNLENRVLSQKQSVKETFLIIFLQSINFIQALNFWILFVNYLEFLIEMMPYLAKYRYFM